MPVTVEPFELPGYQGRPIPASLARSADGSEHLALVFPGWSYGPQAPLLYYTRNLMLAAGCDVLTIDYGYDRLAGFSSWSSERQDECFDHDVNAAADAAMATGSYRRFTLVGKSIGTQAVTRLLNGRHAIAETVTAAIMLTPTLNYPPMLAELPGISTRCLFVLGTEDPANEPALLDIARQVGEVVVIDGADHSFDVCSSVPDSLEAVSRAMERVAEFLDD